LYTLYYYPGNASLLPHMMLREIGVPFELSLVDRAQNMQRSPAYLRLNPNGRIPVLVHDDVVITETAAIALYLAEQHPGAGLAPLPGTPGRARFLSWMVHLTNTPQTEYRPWFYPDQHVIDHAADATVKQAAGERLGRMFALIADQLGDGPWLLGDEFSTADLFLFLLMRWGRAMPNPPRSLPPLAAHAKRVLARPAVQATLAAEGITEPFC
jgi:glutathione S-transferase